MPCVAIAPFESDILPAPLREGTRQKPQGNLAQIHDFLCAIALPVTGAASHEPKCSL